MTGCVLGYATYKKVMAGEIRCPQCARFHPTEPPREPSQSLIDRLRFMANPRVLNVHTCDSLEAAANRIAELEARVAAFEELAQASHVVWTRWVNKKSGFSIFMADMKAKLDAYRSSK